MKGGTVRISRIQRQLFNYQRSEKNRALQQMIDYIKEKGTKNPSAKKQALTMKQHQLMYLAKRTLALSKTTFFLMLNSIRKSRYEMHSDGAAHPYRHT